MFGPCCICCKLHFGSEGLRLSLLVFGAIPRPARMTRAPRQMERAHLMNNTMEKVGKEQARRRIFFGLKHTSLPIPKWLSVLLRKLSAGLPTLVYRSVGKSWQGPLNFIHIEWDTAAVQTPRGRKMFQSTYFKTSLDPSTAGLEVIYNRAAEIYTSYLM